MINESFEFVFLLMGLAILAHVIDGYPGIVPYHDLWTK